MPTATLESTVEAAAAQGDILVVSALTRTFGGLKAVDAVDLTIPRGGLRALIGPNGAGKSTMVNMLSGATRPSSGRICLDGRELAGCNATVVSRAGMVRTFQNGRLFHRLTVLENVLVGAAGLYRNGLVSSVVRSPSFRAEEARMRAHAHALLMRLGMSADSGRVVGSLPYGKQRKIEIARALIGEPKVLLLDKPGAPMLACEDLDVAYGPVTALRGVSLHVGVGECVALLGSNGAGKTTLLRALPGLIRPRGGVITFDGARMAGLSPERRVRAGLAHAPERRRIFPGLTVRENLEVATAAWKRPGQSSAADLDRVYALLPRLKERVTQYGWSLSGGEQQMLAVGRALMSRPRLFCSMNHRSA